MYNLKGVDVLEIHIGTIELILENNTARVSNNVTGQRCICDLPITSTSPMSTGSVSYSNVSVGMMCSFVITNYNSHKGYVINYYNNPSTENLAEPTFKEQDFESVHTATRYDNASYERRDKDGSYSFKFEDGEVFFNRIKQMFSALIKIISIKTKIFKFNVTDDGTYSEVFSSNDGFKTSNGTFAFSGKDNISIMKYISKSGKFLEMLVSKSKEIKMRVGNKTKIIIESKKVEEKGSDPTSSWESQDSDWKIEVDNKKLKLKFQDITFGIEKGIVYIERDNQNIVLNKQMTQIVFGDSGIFIDKKGNMNFQASGNIIFDTKKEFYVKGKKVSLNSEKTMIKSESRVDLKSNGNIGISGQEIKMSSSSVSATITNLVKHIKTHTHWYTAPAIPASPVSTTPDPAYVPRAEIDFVKLPEVPTVENVVEIKNAIDLSNK